MLDAYGLQDKIARLDRAGLLYQVLARFADLDLSEPAVSNETMGYVFEELLRRFSEMSNESAGEHFTPREVIRLMVSIRLAEDREALAGEKPVRTLYDPACGTGGMLTVARDLLRRLNPAAELQAYGQEINAETWAVCRSDLMIQGQDPTQIVLGNSLTGEDGHRGQRFDYLLANPPFGVDWKKYADAVTAERDTLGDAGRYGAGLPRVSDGSLLFLQHMLSKMKSVTEGGGGTRLAIAFSGSPLFAGAAGGGRVRSVAGSWRTTGSRASSRCRTSSSTTPASARTSEITSLYDEALSIDDKRVKVFDREAFGFQRITVERPLRRVWRLTEEAVDELAHSKAWTAWAVPPKGVEDPVAYVHHVEQAQAALGEALRGLTGVEPQPTEKDFVRRLDQALAGRSVPEKVRKAVLAAAAVQGDSAPVMTDRKGQPLPDPDLRDQENVPLPDGWFALGEQERAKALRASADAHLETEIRPYAADAWVDHDRAKVGVEIPVTRHFYEYVPPRPLGEIDAELHSTERRLRELLGGLAR